jgi:hypothetical protein
MRHLIGFGLTLALFVGLGFLPGLASADPPEPQPALTSPASVDANYTEPTALIPFELRSADHCDKLRCLIPQPDTVALLPAVPDAPVLFGAIDPGETGKGGAETAHVTPVARAGPGWAPA